MRTLNRCRIDRRMIIQPLESAVSQTNQGGVSGVSEGELGEGSPDQPPESIKGEVGCFEVDLGLSVPGVDPGVSGWLEDQLLQIAGHMGLCGGRVSVLLIDDAQMTRLHERYKNISSTTDVLTFDLRDDPSEQMDGDLAICVDEARRQGVARGHDTRLEILLYAVHGMLHLMGYDDQGPVEAKLMHRQEDKLLKAIGLGAVYQRTGGVLEDDGLTQNEV